MNMAGCGAARDHDQHGHDGARAGSSSTMTATKAATASRPAAGMTTRPVTATGMGPVTVGM